MGDIDKQIDALKYGDLKEAYGIKYYEIHDKSGPFYRNDTESDYDTSFDKDSGSPSKTTQTVARHPVAWFSPVPTEGIYRGDEFKLKIKDGETVKLHRPERKMRQNPIKQYGDVKSIVGISPTMV